MADDDKKIDQQKKSPEKKKTKESVEYTAKMWDRIGKSASSKKRKGMKKRLENKKNINEMKDNLNKKKQESKKSKKDLDKTVKKTSKNKPEIKNNSLKNKQNKQNDFKNAKSRLDKLNKKRKERIEKTENNKKNIDKGNEFKEKKNREDKEFVNNQDTTAAINPFVESSLPPQEYEDRYKDMEASEQGDLPPSMEDGEVIIGEVESDVVEDVDKAEKVSDKGILKTKSLDEKPLEDVKQAALKSQSNVEVEEKSASEMNQAAEKSSTAAELKKESNVIQVKEVKEVEVSTKKHIENEIKGNLKPDVFPTAEKLKSNNSKTFKQELWDVLEQAGLTKKRLINCFSLLIIIVFGFLFLPSFFGDDNEIGVIDNESEENIVDVNLEEDSSLFLNIVTSYIYGLDDSIYNITNASTTSPLNTAFFFGDTALETENDFMKHLNLVSRMKNIYNVELYNYLNKFSDRTKALNDHIAELGSIISEAQAALSLLDVELRSMEVQYDTMTNTRDIHENEFFLYLNSLNGAKAYDELEIFLEYAQYSSEIKANFNAKKTIFAMIENVLNYLRPRYEDITLNKKALIEGVQVIDVEDSDIDAFIKEN